MQDGGRHCGAENYANACTTSISYECQFKAYCSPPIQLPAAVPGKAVGDGVAT